MGRRRTRRDKEEPKNFVDSILFKYGSRLLLALIVIVAFLTLAQCTVKKPEAPEWNTTFVVPVINRTYDMPELIERIGQDEIIIDTSGDVAFSISEDIDTLQLNESDFSIPDLSYSVSEALDTIEIADPGDISSIISLDSLTRGFGKVPGFDTVLVPPNTQFMADADRQISVFSWADVATGVVKIVVTNQLGLTLYDVVVRIQDNSNGRTIEYDSLEVPLPHGGTDSSILSLSGETFTNDLCFSVVGHTNASAWERIDPNGKQIQSAISFPEPIRVLSALAQIPELEDYSFSQKAGLGIDPSETIDSAHLESGSFNLAITNNSNLSSQVTVTVPSLQQSGSPLVVTRLVSASQTVLYNTDLSGYVLAPEDDSVSVDVVAAIPGSGGSMVLVDYTDEVSVDAGVSDVTFSEVTGMFANTAAQFDDIHEELDVPEGFDNITLATAMLSLDVENGADMPGYVDITITGDNGKVVYLSGDIEPRGDQVSCLTTLTNDEIADFLSPLPGAVDITGTVEFGDGLYHGTISQDDFVFARVRIYAPLDVKVNNAEITDIDIEVEEIDQEDIDKITEHVINARFVYSITNHLPLGVTALVHISNDSVSLFSSPLLVIDPIVADPAPVSLSTGVAIEAATSAGELSLDNEDIQILENDSLFIRQQLFLTASDTSGVKLTESDYVTITGRIEVEYRFDGDF